MPKSFTIQFFFNFSNFIGMKTHGRGAKVSTSESGLRLQGGSDNGMRLERTPPCCWRSVSWGREVPRSRQQLLPSSNASSPFSLLPSSVSSVSEPSRTAVSLKTPCEDIYHQPFSGLLVAFSPPIVTLGHHLCLCHLKTFACILHTCLESIKNCSS